MRTKSNLAISQSYLSSKIQASYTIKMTPFYTFLSLSIDIKNLDQVFYKQVLQ